MMKPTILNTLRNLSIMLAVGGLMLSPAIAEAHDLEVDSGYSAALHIDPDDDPQAGKSVVLNFLIGKDGVSFNQNDYKISLVVLSGGKELNRLSVEPEEFGNAGDGIAKYTFANPGSYTIDLRGSLKADNSPQFHMTYDVKVTGDPVAATQPATHKVPTLAAIGVGGLAVFGGAVYAAKRDSKY